MALVRICGPGIRAGLSLAVPGTLCTMLRRLLLLSPTDLGSNPGSSLTCCEMG